MKKEIKYGFTGGFPFEQDILQRHQEAYSEAFGALEGLIGDKTIVTGSKSAGGWMYINGEFLSFGSFNGADGTFYIDVDEQPLIFDDGRPQKVIITRTIKNGQGVGAIPYEWKDVNELNKYGWGNIGATVLYSAPSMVLILLFSTSVY
jgi:hypothetical protein